MPNSKPLRAAVVGCRMGGAHASAIAKSGELELVALCDLNRETAQQVAEKTGNPPIYTDYEKMLEEVKPDVVSIATPNVLHCSMTLKAVEAGVKGIYCEKPIAVSMGETMKMYKACQEKGVALAVGHQRRMSTPYRTMRKLIENGAIGDVYLIRGICAGDFLSDGTHTVDSIFYLTGNADAEWVLGQVFRKKVNPDEANKSNYGHFTGWRFGHPVESGAMAVIRFKNGIRGEVFTGEMRHMGWNLPHPGWAYQDIEIFGTKGRLWRCGDSANPPLLIWDEKGGWRPASDLEGKSFGDDYVNVFREFANYVRNRGDYPLGIEYAIKTHELVMAVYESARKHDRVYLPLEQERFPLEIMIEDGLI